MSENVLNFNVEEEVGQEKRVKPDVAYNNLCLLGLTSVTVTDDLSSDSKETYEFHGMNVPRLIFNFEQYHSDGVRRVYNYVVSPVVSTKSDGQPMELKTIKNLFTSQYEHIRHIFAAFADLPTNKWKDMKKFKLDGLVLEGTPEERLKSTKKFYTQLSKLFIDTEDKPLYLQSNEKPYRLTAKLILNKNKGGELAKSVAFPAFLNDGFIEMAKISPDGKLSTALEIKATEDVIYRESNPAADLGLPTGGGQVAALDNL